MKNLIIIIVLFIAAQSCKNGNEVESNLSGTYQGTFIRSSMTDKFMPAEVTIIFTEKGYTGTSNTIKYPAIGSGSYKITSDTIKFRGNQSWTSDFDESLVLDGAYHISKEGSEIIIQKDYKDSYKRFDTYRLKLK